MSSRLPRIPRLLKKPFAAYFANGAKWTKLQAGALLGGRADTTAAGGDTW